MVVADGDTVIEAKVEPVLQRTVPEQLFIDNVELPPVQMLSELAIIVGLEVLTLIVTGAEAILVQPF